jgi:surfactin synthase thioesterase subunit
VTEGITLVCFHHAGGSATAFHDWERALPVGVALHAVTLPGRDLRAGEPAHRDVRRLVEQLDGELDPLLARAHVVFGHSMGALVAYRLVQRRLARGARPPEAYFAAAYGAPHLARSVIAGVDLETVDDLELARWLHAFGGLPTELLDRPEWLRLLLGPVRADLRVCASHRYTPAPPLPVPVHVFGGARDPLVSLEDLYAWRAHAAGGFRLTVLDGGHFLVQDRAAGLLPALLRQLAAVPVVRARQVPRPARVEARPA